MGPCVQDRNATADVASLSLRPYNDHYVDLSDAKTLKHGDLVEISVEPPGTEQTVRGIVLCRVPPCVGSVKYPSNLEVAQQGQHAVEVGPAAAEQAHMPGGLDHKILFAL